jgi:hypothetical protein
MSVVDYSLEVYSAVDSIAEELFENSGDRMAERLEEEFGIDFYPLETEPRNDFEKDTANEYLRTSFGISSLLAKEYDEPQDMFFQNRAEDFRGFEQELGDHGNQILTEHLVQFVNLYSAVAEEEEVHVSYTTESIALMDKSGKKDAVLEILDELEDRVLEESEKSRLA